MTEHGAVEGARHASVAVSAGKRDQDKGMK